MLDGSQRRHFILLGFALLALLMTGALLFSTDKAAAQEGPNLLRNGDFEEAGGSAWPFQDNIQEVQIAPGWRAFWRDQRPPYATVPSTCDAGETGCLWARPEFRGMSTAEFPYRVHSGNYSQKYFSFNKQHEAGLYQQVSGIEPGTRLRFTMHVQTWSCQAEGEWNNCPTTPLSNNPAPFHSKVGIDPTGGTNPWAPTVVWSGEFESYDVWTPFWVEATAEAETVTVFFYSLADWPDTWPRLNNDVYLDTASLVAVGEVEPTAPPPPPTSEVPPTPAATPTPRPDGAVVHIVQSGDTLLGIAFQYGVDLDELRRLNAGTLGPNDMLSIGQEIIISGTPIALPTPTPEAAAEATPEGQPTPETQPTEISTAGGEAEPETGGETALCVLAYNDRNGDTVYQSDGEELIPNAVFTVVGTDGPAGSYTTNGINEPHCFKGLQPGNYVIRRTAPDGYALSGPAEWGVALGAGQSLPMSFGFVRGEGAAEAETEAEGEEAPIFEPEESPEEEESEGGLLRKVILGSGIAAVVIAIAVGVLFFLSRRNAL
ncbi:MAG: LysM peptidoglycan-binding domain-containing protein [Anaerolineales bacterium]